MRLFSPVCGALLALVSASSLHAAVVEHDWKVPGDGLLTYDTVNKREWLDLSQTILDDRFPGTGSYAEAILESRYQYVVGQTAAGGLFEGFRVAQSPHARALAGSAGIDISMLNSANNAATLELGNLLGFTWQLPNGNKSAIGVINELHPLRPDFRLGAEFVVLSTVAGLRITNGYPDFSIPPIPPPGVMLYRAIPEPTTLNLLAFLIVAKGALR
jgi:hypothetical protein